jgi:hypothetical protein
MDRNVAKEERPSFLKKRSKRLLVSGVASPEEAAQDTKVFWFFFSKKNILALPRKALTP